MGISSEATARAVIQRIRPTAQKHGLRRAIVDAYLREHLPAEFQSATWDEMKHAPDYEEIRADAEYRSPPFNPDLSEVYPADREIIAFEIQDRCPISRVKLKQIRHWVAVLDGWAGWSLLVVTTNGIGFGWHVLVDTLAEGLADSLADFRQNRESWTKAYPQLGSEKLIVTAHRWRNWKMPSPDEFEAIKQTMSFL